MKVIYIASPYTKGDVAENVRIQMDAAHRIMDAGHCPIAPNLSHFLHMHRARPYEDWMKIDFELINRADLVLRLDGASAGADREVNHANRIGVKVIFGWDSLWLYLNR